MLKLVGQKKFKKGFFNRESKGVSLLAVTKIDTKEEIMIMIFTKSI